MIRPRPVHVSERRRSEAKVSVGFLGATTGGRARDRFDASRCQSYTMFSIIVVSFLSVAGENESTTGRALSFSSAGENARCYCSPFALLFSHSCSNLRWLRQI